MTSELSVTVVLNAASQTAIDAFRRQRDPAMTRAEAVQQIVSEWMRSDASTATAVQPGEPRAGTKKVDEGLRPSELNSSNDI